MGTQFIQMHGRTNRMPQKDSIGSIPHLHSMN